MNKIIMIILVVIIFFNTSYMLNFGFSHAVGPSIAADRRLALMLLFVFFLVQEVIRCIKNMLRHNQTE